MKLEGRAAIVTGGNRGIGRAIALEFARQGADVAFNYRGDEESAKATASDIESLGRKTLARQTNVTDNAAVESMVAEAIDLFGAVDILVCSAGIASQGQPPGRDRGPRDASIAGRAPVRRSSLRKGSTAVHENTGAERRPFHLVHVALQE